MWPQDPGFHAALAGGVTSLQVLPGSANLIGGRGVTLKNVPATTDPGDEIPGRAVGPEDGLRRESEARLRRRRAGRRRAWATSPAIAPRSSRPTEYRKKRGKSDGEARSDGNEGNGDKKDSDADSGGKRDLKLDTLAGAIDGDILVHIHCYRADEMATMLDLAKEFGFKVAAFHHGVEAYKLADRLAAEGVCGALWADWWGFKMEAFDGIQENIALVDRPQNGCAIVHSDSDEGIQRLNQEAAKVMAQRAPHRPRHPARARDPLDHAEPGEIDGHPRQDRHARGRQDGRRGAVERQSLQRRMRIAEQVYVDGARVYDRSDPSRQPESDFMLGQSVPPDSIGGVTEEVRNELRRAFSSSFPRRRDKRAARRTSEGRPRRGEPSESSSDFPS